MMQEYDTHTYIGHDYLKLMDWLVYSSGKSGERVRLVVDSRCAPGRMYGNSYLNELRVHPKDRHWMLIEEGNNFATYGPTLRHMWSEYEPI